MAHRTANSLFDARYAADYDIHYYCAEAAITRDDASTDFRHDRH